MSDIPEADRRADAPHPRDTFDLLGHERAEQVFLKAIASGRLHHAWLITGASGIGKATLAYRMIRHLLGGRSLLETSLDIPESDPVAGRISARGHGNLHVVTRPYDTKTKKLKSEVPVASIRALTDFFHETAAESGLPRIGLIDKADELNTSSENAVLKLLEEPPEQGMLFLLADSPGQLLPTIRSRCLNLDLRPVPTAQLRPWLASRTELGDRLDRVVWLARGAPGLALAWAKDDVAMKAIDQFASILADPRATKPVQLVQPLVGVKARDSRDLFWGGVQDLLSAASAQAGGADWTAPFPEPRASESWRSLWQQSLERERVTDEINMDARAALLDLISDARAA